MEKKIQIRIMPDGTVESKTINIRGKECTKYAEIISNLTDSRIIAQQHTEEYYEVVGNTRNEEENQKERQVIGEKEIWVNTHI